MLYLPRSKLEDRTKTSVFVTKTGEVKVPAHASACEGQRPAKAKQHQYMPSLVILLDSVVTQSWGKLVNWSPHSPCDF
jgi:hypothetical protein